MNGRGQTPVRPGERASGPQGTRLFSAEELRQYASALAPGQEARASVQGPVLQGTSTGCAGRRFMLRQGRQTVGRRGDNDIVIDDPSVSASHAWLMSHPGHYAVMNTLSTNGTFVNGKRVHEAALKHGDRVRFGQAEFVFLTREPGAPHPARGRLLALATLAVLALAAAIGWFIQRP